MNPQDFCYWLRGFTELMHDKEPTQEQWKIITNHLASVFNPVISLQKEIPVDYFKPIC